MSKAQTSETMSPQLLKVVARAKQDPQTQFYSLTHLIDFDALKHSFTRIAAQSAVGVDQITKSGYGEHLERNLTVLLQRMKSGQYRHQPIRRVQIPKENGKTRPIGIPCLEDKIVQGAVREVMEAIYEQDFLDCSYGFRPGRSAHDAIRRVDQELKNGTSCVLEADIKSFFDTIDHAMLFELLQQRIVDGAILRLLRKFLHAGIVEGEQLSFSEEGTPQGGVISPLLANIYLHYVLDLWFEQEVKSRLSGRACLVRYADDFVMTFERKEDAERVMEVLPKRLAKYGLTLHPEKTRLIPFGLIAQEELSAEKQPTFDFLGFTLYQRMGQRVKKRVLRWKTRRARLGRAIQSVDEWCRTHRHCSIPEQHRMLRRKLLGHFNYFGVNGNTEALSDLLYWVKKKWKKWLSRRSQKGFLSWERMSRILKEFPLPIPKVYVPIW